MQKTEENEVINHLANQIRKEFAGEGTGHDWYHIERVWKMAKYIAEKENANQFVTELGALLHDIADHKFVKNADEVAENRVAEFLEDLSVDSNTISKVIHVVHNCSFKGGVVNEELSLECKIVQDADRLDAIGAIGIARTFAYGGSIGNPIYDPHVEPCTFKNAKEYLNKRTHTINHFYEKLLKLKDGMNTASGQKLAQERHLFMEKYLVQFYAEWESKMF